MATYPRAISFAQFTGNSSPLLADAGSNDRPAQGQAACPKPWGVTEITLSAGGKSSKSYSDRGHTDVAAGRQSDGRFYFAPKSDRVDVVWKLKNPGNAGMVKLELFAAGSGRPIWQRSLAGDAARKGTLDAPWDGSFPANEWIASVEFPHGLVTVEHSPYQLKITADASAEAGFVERWTYFDVLVERIEMHWGGVARIPAGPPAGVGAAYATRTQADERSIVVTLAGNPAGTGPVDPARRQDIKLPCNQFPQSAEEQKDDSMFAGYRDMWGDGPRIPLLAKIWLRTATDGGVHGTETAKALGQARFLWDWESEDELAKLNARYPIDNVKDFLRNTLDYKRIDNGGPPGSTNCHVEHGGKRGSAATVFPAAGAPYPVTRCTTRVWASTSLAALDGADAGVTGVIFQPSRMALDTYRVTVYLASEMAASGPELDVLGTGADLQRDHPELPMAQSGWFEMHRVIRSRYIRKAPAVEVANTGMSTTEYARAGLILDWVAGAGDEPAFQANYNTYYDRILQNQLHNEADVAQFNFKKPAADLVRAMADAFEGIDQFTGNTAAGVAPAFTAHEYPVFVEKMKVKVIRQYVCSKPRKFNKPKDAYDAWRVVHPLPADDSAWLLAFYGRLKAARRRKIDDTLRNDLINNATRDLGEYRNKIGNVAVQGFKVIAGQHLNATADDGFICFHCADSVQMRLAAGGFIEVPTNVGGLAPSDSTTADRKKAINLMYLLQTVPPGRVGVPNVYDVSVSPIIKHEVGHNFYLGHAPADPAAPREAGGFVATNHDAADMRCLMNYDYRTGPTLATPHLCGLCVVRLRGWALKATSGAGLVNLSNVSVTNRVP